MTLNGPAAKLITTTPEPAPPPKPVVDKLVLELPPEHASTLSSFCRNNVERGASKYHRHLAEIGDKMRNMPEITMDPIAFSREHTKLVLAKTREKEEQRGKNVVDTVSTTTAAMQRSDLSIIRSMRISTGGSGIACSPVLHRKQAADGPAFWAKSKYSRRYEPVPWICASLEPLITLARQLHGTKFAKRIENADRLMIVARVGVGGSFSGSVSAKLNDSDGKFISGPLQIGDTSIDLCEALTMFIKRDVLAGRARSTPFHIAIIPDPHPEIGDRTCVDLSAKPPLAQAQEGSAPDRVMIDMDNDVALTLLSVTANISGSTESTYRGHTDKISVALRTLLDRKLGNTWVDRHDIEDGTIRARKLK